MAFSASARRSSTIIPTACTVDMPSEALACIAGSRGVEGAAHAHAGKMDEAKAALAEAHRRNPKLTVKWMIGRKPNMQPAFDALRKAGMPEE